MKRKITFLTAAFTLLAFLAIPLGMRGQEVTLDFTTNECWGLPTDYTTGPNNYTCGDYTITLAGSTGNGYKYNTGYLIFGKSGAYLQLPAFSFNVTKIEVVGRAGASGQVKQNIYVGETAVSTETSGATGTNTYMINADYQAIGNIYTLMITSNHNSQVTEIKVYGTAPTITINSEDIELGAAESDVESVTVTYNNLDERIAEVALYSDAECNNSVTGVDNFWFTADFATNDDETIEYMALENEGAEPRTVYMRVEATDGDELYYSNVITVTQAAPVVTYTITFNAGEGTFVGNTDFPSQSNTKTAGTYTLPSATRDGYTFDGWLLTGNTEPLTGTYTVSGNADFTAQYTENTTPTPGGNYVLFTGSLEEGDYVIFYSGRAMKNTVSNNRLQYTDVTPSNNVISNPDASLVWHIAPSGDYWTIYNEDVAKYAAGNGTKNQAALVETIGTDGDALWTASGTGTYEFVNKKNATANVNCNLRNNTTYGFACYGTGTGGALTLYKYQSEAPAVATPTFSPAAGTYYEAKNVTIDCETEGVTIYYTTDGSDPDNGSTVYNDPIAVTQTTTIKAIAYDAEDNASAIGTATYTIVSMQTIAQVREQGTGDVLTKGTITSISGNGTKTAYMQDATAAIVVYGSFTAAVGDEIRVSGTLSDFNGLLEITSPQVTVISSGNTIEPTLMTIAEINTSTNQGWYIRIEDATVTAIEGNYTTIAQGENTVNVYKINSVNVDDVISFNGNIGYHDGLQIVNPTEVTVGTSGYAYQYSINGVLGEVQHGTDITLANGEAVGGLAFAGWTLNPNDVDNILAAGDSYELTADGVIFYAVYSRSVDMATHTYVKVTEAPEDWSGKYLIVYETGGVAFDGGLQTLDAADNTINVSFDGDAIISNYATNAAVFTFAPIYNNEQVITGYSIKSTSGYYIGKTANANGLDYSTKTVYQNTLSIDEGNNVVITASGGCTMRYNAASDQKRFRYYKSGQKAVQLYKQEGEADFNTSYYTRVFNNETATADIEIVGPSIIPSGSSLNMNYSYSITNALGADKFIIEDGAQLDGYYSPVSGTMLKNINACNYVETNNAGYYLITSPFGVEPSAVNGMITSNYDLYAYDPSEDLEWRNFKAGEFTSLTAGHGYLYANGDGTTLEFAGTLNASFLYINNLNYDGGDELNSLTLAGNPAAMNVEYCLYNQIREGGIGADEGEETNFLYLNSAGDGFLVEHGTSFTAQPLQGFFVQATGANQYILKAGAAIGEEPGDFKGNLNIKVNRNSQLIDNAIVSFGNGSMMKKFYLSETSTRVYIPQNGKDYAVVRSANEGEMPVNFKAETNSTYTISVNTDNVEMNYLHLIDNKTGADVDLLVEPSYSFEANTDDYASRFRLMFKANANVSENVDAVTFAFFNGSTWNISNVGEATLQVVDVMGRVLSSETVNGNAEFSLNQVPGVYMLRLVNGENVKVQKVVVR